MTNRFMPIFPTENICLFLYLCMLISDTWISVLWSSAIIKLCILFKILINKIVYLNILIVIITVDCHKWSFVWYVPDSPYPWQRGWLLSEMWHSSNIMHYLYVTSHFPHVSLSCESCGPLPQGLLEFIPSLVCPKS